MEREDVGAGDSEQEGMRAGIACRSAMPPARFVTSGQRSFEMP
jgi:hypothetical protein